MTHGAAISNLRRWQRLALQAWIANAHRGTVEVATGAGKTLFALACARHALDRNLARRVLVVVPTIALADQWVASILEDMGLPDREIEVVSGGRMPSATAAMFTVAVFNTARNLVTHFRPSDGLLLIVDECHRVGSPENSRILGLHTSASLGLSATPFRKYDQATEDVVLPALGRVIFVYDIAAALADGVLIPYDLVNVSVPLLPAEQRSYDELTVRIARLSKKSGAEDVLAAILRRRARVAALAKHRVPVAIRILDNHAGERAIVFHESIADADNIAAGLRKRGHSVAVYHTRLSASLRADNLRLYRRGVFDVLVSCRALDEGVNIPETRVAVIASSTRTERQRIQRLGRALRPAPGKERAVVYTLYAVRAEEEQLLSEADGLGPDTAVTWQRTRVQRG